MVTHWVDDDVLAYLAEFAEPVAPAERTVFSPGEVLAHARDASGILACMADQVDEAFLGRCPRLKVIGAALKGYDNFDADACARHGVWLTTVPDLLTEPTADLAVALTLDLTRRVTEADRHLREQGFGGWRPQFYGTGLAGSTVGLLGMGEVGRAVARRLGGFGCELLYTDRKALSPAAEERLGARRCSFEDLLRGSDVVIALLPLTDSTHHLIDAKALGLLKRGAYLVNVGRGSVVDEHAVAEALFGGSLGGYAADVFETEDRARADRPDGIAPGLLDHPHTVLTPHLGSAVTASRRDIELTAARQIVQVLSGDPPDHAVNRPRVS